MTIKSKTLDIHPVLSSVEERALLDWQGIDLSKCNNSLAVAGAVRNTIRWAELWGPKLVAMLMTRGLIGDDDTPENALERQLDMIAVELRDSI